MTSRDQTAPRHPKRTRRRGVTASVAAGLALVAVAGGVAVAGTAASYTDASTLNTGATGIGFAGAFDIGIVTAEGTVEQADGPEGFAWSIPDAERLVPGGRITTELVVFNNTDRLGADTVFSLGARNGDGTVGSGVPNITPLLRFTAVDEAGAVLFDAVPLAEAHAAIGVLAPRDGEPQLPGDDYAPGAAGSERRIDLTVDYPDVPGVEAYNGGQAALFARFDASSVQP